MLLVESVMFRERDEIDVWKVSSMMMDRVELWWVEFLLWSVIVRTTTLFSGNQKQCSFTLRIRHIVLFETTGSPFIKIYPSELWRVWHALHRMWEMNGIIGPFLERRGLAAASVNTVLETVSRTGESYFGTLRLWVDTERAILTTYFYI